MELDRREILEITIFITVVKHLAGVLLKRSPLHFYLSPCHPNLVAANVLVKVVCTWWPRSSLIALFRTAPSSVLLLSSMVLPHPWPQRYVFDSNQHCRMDHFLVYAGREIKRVESIENKCTTVTRRQHLEYCLPVSGSPENYYIKKKN